MPNISLQAFYASLPTTTPASPPDPLTPPFDPFGRVPIHPFRNLLLSAIEDFPEEFEVPVVSYHRTDTVLPQALLRVNAISERLFPVPANFRLAENGEILDSDGITARGGRATITRLFKAAAAHSVITTGRITSLPGGPQDFIALGIPDAKEFRVDLSGNFTSPDGKISTVLLAADGGVLPDARTEDGFSAETEGSIFRLLQTGPDSLQIEESDFGSLQRIAVTDATTAEVTMTGSLLVNGTPKSTTLRITSDENFTRVLLADQATNETLYDGTAPRERNLLRLLGARAPVGKDEGHVILYNKETRAELRRIPISGRMTGLAFDGTHLLQTLWPSGKILKIDPAAENPVVGEITPIVDGKIAGVSVEGDILVVSVCQQNILANAGGTTIQQIDVNGNPVGNMPRPHEMSSGFDSTSERVVGIVNGADQTPVSSECMLLFLDKNSGETLETIIFPRNFFLEDVCAEAPGKFLATVTEGLKGIGQNCSVYRIVIN